MVNPPTNPLTYRSLTFYKENKAKKLNVCKTLAQLVLDSTKMVIFFFILIPKTLSISEYNTGASNNHSPCFFCTPEHVLRSCYIVRYLTGRLVHVTISPFRPVSFSHIVSLLFSPLPSDMYGLTLVSLWILSPPFSYCFLWGYLPSFLLLAYLSVITRGTSEVVSLHV